MSSYQVLMAVLGTLPAAYSALTALGHVFMNGNALTGTLPADWASLSRLNRIDLQNNNLTGTLPAAYSALTALRHMDIDRNALTGLPSCSVQCYDSNYISQNRQQPPYWGTVPTSFSALTALSSLQIQSNNFTGRLPSEWSRMTNLGIMSAANNRFTGTLPAAYSALTALASLMIDDNLLTGTLPADWASLSRLNRLDLGNNNLMGTLPYQYWNLTALTVLDVSNNFLIGEICSATAGSDSIFFFVVSVTALPIMASAAPFIGSCGRGDVKRGTPYAFCNGTIPTADQLCEPGALAFEFSLAGVNATLEDANNVTQHIVACPRPDCLVGTPCSKVDLGAMSLVNRGLGGCAIDTLAPIGSIFPVAFWVWDYDPAAPNFCRDGFRFYCSPSDCRTSQVYLPDPTEVPIVKLLPLNTATFFIQLGNVPPFSLAPCPSLAQNSSCGAVAYTKYPGSPVIVQDLTDKIKVTSTTNCKDNPSNCRGCALTQMSLGGGLCLAGTYKLRYSITFQQTGVTRQVERTVIIYNTSYSDFPVTRVYDSLTNYSLAVNVVDAINSGSMSRSEFMQAQNRVATAVLPQLSFRDANVELFNATLPPPPDPVRVHDVYADVRIHKYTPSTMDLGNLTVFNAALAVAAASEKKNRRMIVEDHEWEKLLQAIQTRDGWRKASRLTRIVELHGWMALADTDWLMQQTHNLDTSNGPSPWDMYLSEEASPAMPLHSVVNKDGTPLDSNEFGRQDAVC
eukprot:gene26816-4408_t